MLEVEGWETVIKQVYMFACWPSAGQLLANTFIGAVLAVCHQDVSEVLVECW